MSTDYRHFVDAGGRVISARVGTPLLDHLAATHTEVQVAPLDAVVVEGPLPEVDPERPGYSGYVGLDGPGSAETKPIPLMGSVESYVESARRNLAVAKYLSGHPASAVDEDQVQAIFKSLAGMSLEGTSLRAVARRLYTDHGFRVEVAS